MYPYGKKYDTWVKINDMRGVLIQRKVLPSIRYMTILQVSTWFSVEKKIRPYADPT